MAVQTFTIAANGDDAQWDSDSSWNASLVANAIVAGNYANNSNRCGWLRFTGVTVAQGSTITLARLLLNNNGGGNGGGTSANIRIQCEAADNPTMPSNLSDANGRSMTTGITLAQSYTTSIYAIDITSEVQAVVNRSGFASGNALAVTVRDNASGGHVFIQFCTREAGASLAAQLEITTPDPTGNPWYYYANQAAALAS